MEAHHFPGADMFESISLWASAAVSGCVPVTANYRRAWVVKGLTWAVGVHLNNTRFSSLGKRKKLRKPKRKKRKGRQDFFNCYIYIGFTPIMDWEITLRMYRFMQWSVTIFQTCNNLSYRLTRRYHGPWIKQGRVQSIHSQKEQWVVSLRLELCVQRKILNLNLAF